MRMLHVGDVINGVKALAGPVRYCDRFKPTGCKGKPGCRGYQGAIVAFALDMVPEGTPLLTDGFPVLDPMVEAYRPFMPMTYASGELRKALSAIITANDTDLAGEGHRESLRLLEAILTREVALQAAKRSTDAARSQVAKPARVSYTQSAPATHVPTATMACV